MTLEQAKRLDTVLHSFVKNRGVKTMSLRAHAEEIGMPLGDIENCFHQLNYEEYVAWGTPPTITGRGEIFYYSGGYTAQVKKEKWNEVLVLIAAVASVIGAVIGAISLLQRN